MASGLEEYIGSDTVLPWRHFCIHLPSLQ
jgi:hypothetical protein